jgi:SM-20-related protein
MNTSVTATFDHSAGCEAIASILAERGWCVTPQFISPILANELRREGLEFYSRGAFRPAGIGRGGQFQVNHAVRTDRIYWLDPSQCSDSQRQYLAILERLRQTVNQTLFLGLADYEGHFALYPPGTYYRRHVDQFVGAPLRTVTAILYLNAAWHPDDGGQLRLYWDTTRPDHYEEILPLDGQLVTFLSADYPHEVLPAQRDRLSLTGWFRRRP